MGVAKAEESALRWLDITPGGESRTQEGSYERAAGMCLPAGRVVEDEGTGGLLMELVLLLIVGGCVSSREEAGSSDTERT